MKMERHKIIPLTLEIAPLVDVIFLLLIFFLLTSLAQKGVQLELPSSQHSPIQKEGLVVFIDESGQVLVKGKTVSLTSLPGVLKNCLGEGVKKEVIIKADGNLPFHLPVKVMDMISRAGIERIVIATRLPGRKERK